MVLLDYFAKHPHHLAALWVVAGVLIVALLFRRPSRLVLASGDAGKLEISRHALNRLLETCCEQVSGVAWARARVRRRGGMFKTRLRLKVRPDARLDAIQGYLSQEVRDIYRQNLGIQNVGPVEIQVIGVISEPRIP